MNWQILSVSKGGAAPLSNYIWGRGDFNYKDEIVATGCGNLPHWCFGDPFVLWQASDRYERQKGAAARHLIVSLPRELGRAEWVDLVEKLISTDVGLKPFQYAIHVPRANEQDSHPHAHILYCDRVPDGIEREPETFFRRPNPIHPEMGGRRKDTGGQSPQEMGATAMERRKVWADLQNGFLAAGGHQARVDYRSRRSLPLS